MTLATRSIDSLEEVFRDEDAAEALADELGAPYPHGLRLSRRQLFEVAMLGSLAVALPGCGPVLQQLLDRIRNRPVRRDIVTLFAGNPSDPILEAYKKAIRDMKALPTTDARNWTRQAQIHNNFCPHGNWLLLPWHRAYLFAFEEICRELSGMNDFALPYWNWQKDTKVPNVFLDPANELFHANRPGVANTLPSSLFDKSYIESILDETNFLLFASGQIPAGGGQRDAISQARLESGPHNRVHTSIGGTMTSFMSPLDPIFWTHHGVIDAIWVEWNIKRANPNTNDTNWVNWKFTEFCDRAGNPKEVTVLETILYPFFSYRYDDPVLGEP
jgi:tyrosinase